MPRLAACLPLVLMASLGHAATIHVPGDQPTIQAGIDVAAAGDTVEVACGTYYEHDIALKSSISLFSESQEPECVTVDAQQLGRVFLGMSLASDTHISGLTIANGSTPNSGAGIHLYESHPRISNCVFQDNETTGQSLHAGGALWCERSSPTVTACSFLNNQASVHGGALFCYSFQADPFVSDCVFEANRAIDRGGAIYTYQGATPTIVGSVFRGNEARTGGAGNFHSVRNLLIQNCEFVENSAHSNGGAVYVGSRLSPVIVDCLFRANLARHQGGAWTGGGGAIKLSGGGTIRNCVFDSNESYQKGGAVYVVGDRDRSPTIEDCRFEGNRCDQGGALYIWRSLPTVQRCVVIDGSASFAGVCFASESDLLFLDSTLSANSVSTPGYGAAFYLYDATARIVRTIITAGSGGGPVGLFNGGTAIISCSDIFGNSGGDWVDGIADQANINGNFSADPLFCDPAIGDYTLRPNSPCAPPGLTGCGLVGALPVGCVAVSVEEATWAGVKSKYRNTEP